MSHRSNIEPHFILAFFVDCHQGNIPVGLVDFRDGGPRIAGKGVHMYMYKCVVGFALLILSHFS